MSSEVANAYCVVKKSINLPGYIEFAGGPFNYEKAAECYNQLEDSNYSNHEYYEVRKIKVKLFDLGD